ncbi:MAG: prepilin peptidase [Kiritimatiellia bacterium]|nr:prepilin peptidase [Kiritimatiellia bacterium]
MNIHPAYAWLTLMVACLGACVGSFLNVCIYRIPRDESVIRPRSHCPHCGRMIPAFENIPLLSFLWLRGRCRGCRAPIAFRYILVEALTAILFLWVWHRFGWEARTPVYWMVASGLILGTFVDFDHMILPDRVTLGGIIAGLALSPLIPSLHGATAAWPALRSALIGTAVGLSLLGSVAVVGQWVFRKEAMGMGDVKLLGAVGALLGWQAALFTVIASAFAGSIVGLALIFRGAKGLQSKIPYGPYLALAAMAWILGADRIWLAYFDWISR